MSTLILSVSSGLVATVVLFVLFVFVAVLLILAVFLFQSLRRTKRCLRQILFIFFPQTRIIVRFIFTLKTYVKNGCCCLGERLQRGFSDFLDRNLVSAYLLFSFKRGFRQPTSSPSRSDHNRCLRRDHQAHSPHIRLKRTKYKMVQSSRSKLQMWHIQRNIYFRGWVSLRTHGRDYFFHCAAVDLRKNSSATTAATFPFYPICGACLDFCYGHFKVRKEMSQYFSDSRWNILRTLRCLHNISFSGSSIVRGKRKRESE